jgi:hypothetical protein
MCVIPFLCEAAPNLAHAGVPCTCSREFTRRVIKRSLIKNWYYRVVPIKKELLREKSRSRLWDNLK